MLIKQVLDYRKVRSENLKFSTDLQDQVMDGWTPLRGQVVDLDLLLLVTC